jgi:hypothetical protein
MRGTHRFKVKGKLAPRCQSVQDNGPQRRSGLSTRATTEVVRCMCKVQWSHHAEDEATWEHEEELRVDYPELFLSAS